MKTTFLALTAVLALVLAASPCVAQSPTRQVRILFNADVAGKPFACDGVYDNIGPSHARVKPVDLRFFVSQVELLTADGAFVALSLDQDGFKFLRAEVATVADPNARPASGRRHANGFPVHVGSTGCAVSDIATAPANECAHPNRASVTLRAFDIDHDTVVFDLAKLLAGVDVDSLASVQSPGCMSFPGTEACGAPMRALGLPFDGAPAAEQTVFSGEAQH